MTAITEAIHAGAFLEAEAPGTLSRETGTVKSGEVLKAGQLVMLSGTELVAHDGALDTDGNLVTAVEGIMFDAVDASGGAVANSVYIARLAEVKDVSLTYPTETTAGGEKDACIASLKLLNIRPR